MKLSTENKKAIRELMDFSLENDIDIDVEFAVSDHGIFLTIYNPRLLSYDSSNCDCFLEWARASIKKLELQHGI